MPISAREWLNVDELVEVSLSLLPSSLSPIEVADLSRPLLLVLPPALGFPLAPSRSPAALHLTRSALKSATDYVGSPRPRSNLHETQGQAAGLLQSRRVEASEVHRRG